MWHLSWCNCRIMPNKKNIFENFDYSWTMINMLIIFLTQNFQEKKHELVVRISFFNQRVQGLILFSNLFFYPWTKWLKEISLGKFFKLDAPGKRDVFLGRRQNINPNHVPTRRRGLCWLGEQLPLGRNWLNCFGEQSLECLTRKYSK
jgi:hypothetical protein